jgi:4'-phosphopantetheinyl transferase
MPDELCVWHASLDVEPGAQRRFVSLLSPDEHARVARLRFERDRRRFVAARGILRSILGHRLGAHPGLIRFAHGVHGKPHLADPDAARTIHFSVSYSGDDGMFAVASCRVGVDIEVLRPVPEAAAIAARYFAPRERAALSALAEEMRATAFMQCWTRMEAYIKGLGEGFSHPIDLFEVTAPPGSPPWLVVADAAGEASWRLADVSRLPAYAAAVAWNGAIDAPRVDDWQNRQDLHS